jgi:hypothetical protein
MPNINEAFPSQYLKASDLKGRTVVVEIDRVEFEPVGQNKEMKPILYFADKDKGLVLNKTNANKIASLLETPVTEEWAGCTVAIYPTETSFQGDQVECIRVKSAPRQPAQPRRQMPVQEPPMEPITDDDIPFAWLLPFVLPALGLLSGGVVA